MGSFLTFRIYLFFAIFAIVATWESKNKNLNEGDSWQIMDNGIFGEIMSLTACKMMSRPLIVIRYRSQFHVKWQEVIFVALFTGRESIQVLCKCNSPHRIEATRLIQVTSRLTRSPFARDFMELQQGYLGGNKKVVESTTDDFRCDSR